ncbi:hypothetical protein GF389_01490 [Candidatus Dojkabacteria bacterium]|nr:hypothetical protein [Candidatus Dojkabacteria bacterium]
MTKLQDKPDVFVVGGPTASGKTSLAIELAKKNDGELINADSMQVYRGMDIGTNKGLVRKLSKSEAVETEALGEKFTIHPFEVENSGVTSWLFDVVDPDFDFTVAHYQIIASQIIQEILDREKVPIIVGGTGLYIDAILKGYEIEVRPDRGQRERLNQLSIEKLQEKLEKTGFDLNVLNNSDRNNPRRLIRLIEKQNTSHVRQNSSIKLENDYEVTFYYPKYDREELMKRIETRAREMIEDGLVDEVRGLMDRGYGKDLKSMQATGYREVVQSINGEIKTKKELIEKIALSHKQYAKRQITWFEGEGRGYNLQFVERFGTISV